MIGPDLQASAADTHVCFVVEHLRDDECSIDVPCSCGTVSCAYSLRVIRASEVMNRESYVLFAGHLASKVSLTPPQKK